MAGFDVGFPAPIPEAGGAGFYVKGTVADVLIDSGVSFAAGDLAKLEMGVAKLPDRLVSQGKILPASTSTTGYYHSVLLSPTLAVLAYGDDANAGYLTIVAIAINGAELTLGQKTVVNSYNSQHISLERISGTQCVVVFADSASGSQGAAIILTIAGLSVSAGAKYVYRTTYTVMNSVAYVDSSRLFVVFRYNDNYLYGVVLSYSGNTITGAGTITTILGAGVSFIRTASFGNTRVGLHVGHSVYTVFMLGFTSLTPNVGNALGTNIFYNKGECCAISSTKLLLVSATGDTSFRCGIVTDPGTASIPTLSTELWMFTPVSSISYVACAYIATNRVIAICMDSSVSKVAACIVDVSGATPVLVSSAYVHPYTSQLFRLAGGYPLNAALFANTSALDGYKMDVSLLVNTISANGVALTAGVAGETKKFLDWRTVA